MKPFALVVIAAATLAADFAAAQSTVTPPNFQMPQGRDCGAEIARYRAVQENDHSMGHVATSVYNQIKIEIAGAEKLCAAGQDAKAKAMVRASKQRHGYPLDL